MKLAAEFFRLPFTFDVERLQQEVASFDSDAWLTHPAGFDGNYSIPLISVDGGANDLFNGPMKSTRQLGSRPYLRQVIASFNEVVGRSRLMRLDKGCEVPEHSDINYHWNHHVRIHIPILTNPQVTFFSGDKRTHMPAGETWLLDTWKMHRVINGGNETRIHLVIDTCGSAKFWDMVAHSERPCDNDGSTQLEKTFIPYTEGKQISIATEHYNAPMIMPPGEVDALTIDIIEDCRSSQGNDRIALEKFTLILNHFRWDWRALWSQYGLGESGWPHYAALVKTTVDAVTQLGTTLQLASNEAAAIKTFLTKVVYASLNTDLAKQYLGRAPQSGSYSAVSQLNKLKPSQSPATTTQPKTPISRNAPCPCGSGKKYKRCHGS